MTAIDKTTLLTQIATDLPDNNAGLISAQDIRENMIDIVDSMTRVVGSGMSTATPFVQNIKVQHNPDSGQGGLIYCSGIVFDNGGTQTLAVDKNNISHSDLQNKTADDHPQYLLTNGARQTTGDFGFGNYWVNSSGSLYSSINPGYRGFRFQYVSNDKEIMHIGSGTTINFLKDNSKMDSARGVAKAWINFDATSSTPVVNDSFNVSGLIKESAGQFVVVINSGVFSDNNYVAIAQSNASSAADVFQKNTVGLISRELRVDGTRSIEFKVIDDGGDLSDAKFNDLVLYGTEPNGSSQPPVTVTVL
jgi:hypothetical protein